MKKIFWMICPALLVSACLHTASAEGLDAYRPKKTGSSLSCRFDDPCNQAEKPVKRSVSPRKPARKAGKHPYMKRTHHHVR